MEHIRDILKPIMKGVGVDLKAIPTEYNGIKYRSRLEARWVVFLDALGIEHYYEFEGFQLPSAWYVPDFWLPRLECWLEIKPKELVAGSREAKLATELCWATKKNVFVAWDLPEDSDGIEVDLWLDGGAEWDSGYGFAECGKCGRIGIEFGSRGERVCGARCFPESDRGIGWTERIEQARQKAVLAQFWNSS